MKTRLKKSHCIVHRHEYNVISIRVSVLINSHLAGPTIVTKHILVDSFESGIAGSVCFRDDNTFGANALNFPKEKKNLGKQSAFAFYNCYVLV